MTLTATIHSSLTGVKGERGKEPEGKGERDGHSDTEKGIQRERVTVHGGSKKQRKGDQGEGETK